MKIIYKNGDFIIDEVREHFNSDLCGLKKGMQIIGFNSLPIKEAINPFLQNLHQIMMLLFLNMH